MLVCGGFLASAGNSPYPSLIPLPQKINWTDESFPLNIYKAIFINDTSLKKSAADLQKITGNKSPVILNSKSKLTFQERL